MKDAVTRYEAAKARVERLRDALLDEKTTFDREHLKEARRWHQRTLHQKAWTAFLEQIKPLAGVLASAERELDAAKEALAVTEPEGVAA